MSTAIEVAGLHAGHGAHTVLHAIAMQAHAGQWLAIVGPNGAGKSTLLRCLAGLLPASAGQVRLQGQLVSSWPARARARRVAWLGQGSVGDEAMSVYDTVALGRLPHRGWLGWPGLSAQDHLAVDQALADTDMAWAARRPLAALSGGERQRVYLARALAVQADVLLLDEPVVHLDAPHQRLLAQVLRREAAHGRCVISVLHELPLALAADQLLVMQRGTVAAHGHRDDPGVHRALESVFEQAIALTRVDDRWVVVPRL